MASTAAQAWQDIKGNLAMASLNIAPFLALAASLALTGCGNSGEDISAPVAEAPPVMASEAPPAAPAAEPDTSAIFAALPAPYNAADYNRGRRTYKLCQSCHTLPQGGASLVGPNLYGMFGRQIGGVEGFAYSKAVQEADFVWTPEMLDQWLANPRDFLPGNKMSFAGVRRPEDRLGVIAYIMVETGYSAE